MNITITARPDVPGGTAWEVGLAADPATGQAARVLALCTLTMERVPAEPGYIALRCTCQGIDVSGALAAPVVPCQYVSVPTTALTSGQVTLDEVVQRLRAAVAKSHVGHLAAEDAVAALGIPFAPPPPPDPVPVYPAG